jgi:hypothetical protein
MSLIIKTHTNKFIINCNAAIEEGVVWGYFTPPPPQKKSATPQHFSADHDFYGLSGCGKNATRNATGSQPKRGGLWSVCFGWLILYPQHITH